MANSVKLVGCGAARHCHRPSIGLCLLLVLVALNSVFEPPALAATGFGAPPARSAKIKKRKGFGSGPVSRQEEEKRRQQRLGKDASTKAARKKLLSETAEQVFRVADMDIPLLVPAYVKDYGRFAGIVESGVGTVSDIVWPAEQALADTLLQRSHLWRPAGLLELGAGLSFAGLVAAKAGAPRVALTDRDDLVLEIAKKSAILNGVEDRVSIDAFDWEDRSRWPEPFGGLVAAADVLYDKEVVSPLVDLISHLGGSALLVEPDNLERRQLGSIPYFEEMARAKGLVVHEGNYLNPAQAASPMLIVSVSSADAAARVQEEGTEVFDAATQQWLASG